MNQYFIVTNESGNLRHSLFSTPSVVTRAFRQEYKTLDDGTSVVILNGCNGLQYLFNMRDGTLADIKELKQ